MSERPSALDVALDGLDQMLKDEISQHAKNAQISSRLDPEALIRGSYEFYLRMRGVIHKVIGGGAA